MRARRFGAVDWVLLLILGGLAIRVWCSNLTESLDLDETLTAFAAKYGVNHPSLDAAPGVRQTLYYPLVRLVHDWFGFSELGLRLPSLLMSLASLFLLWRLAARLIHPDAGWIAVFLYFVPRSYALQATGARPYAPGMLSTITAAWFLIRFLDAPRRREFAAGFCLCAVVLGWTQFLLTPVLAVFGVYAIVRLVRGETQASWTSLLWMAGGVLIGLTPLATGLVGLADEAQTHIFAEAPSFGELVRALQLPAVGAVSAISWLVSRVLRGSGAPTLRSDQVLIAAWWLGPPLLLWLLAQTAEVNLFVPRYFATAAAGMALAGAYAAAASIPASYLRHTGAVLGVAILVLSFVKAPPSREASWRDAAKLVSQWSSTPSVILCPSGFIEAQPPEWSETYSLPGFLYAPLDAYPVPGDRLLLPTREARQPVELVEARVRTAAARGESILIYGGASAAGFWVEWLDDHAELAGWHREVKMFGSVTAARYSK